MQKYISLFFSVLLFLTACQSSNVPDGVIREEEMIRLMTDVHIADGAIYNIPQVPDSLYKYGSAKFAAVFKKHHTTDDAFKKSLKYYSTQPEQMQDIYTKIDAVLKAKIDSINHVTAQEAARKADSASKKKPGVKKNDTVVQKKPDTIKPPINPAIAARDAVIKARMDSLKNRANNKKTARKKIKNVISS